MNEVLDTLTRALNGPIVVTFTNDAEAKNWQFRALNYIRRHAPNLAQLMITRNGRELKIRVPKMEVRDDT